MKQKLTKWMIPLLSVIFVAIFPAIFLYGNNSDQVNLQDVMQPMFIFLAIALAFFVFFFLIIRNSYKAAIIAIVFMLVFENFAALENLLLVIFPDLRYWHTIAIWLFIILHLAYFIYRFLPSEIEKSITSVLCLVFGMLIVMNGLIAIPGVINKVNAKKLQLEKEQETQSQADMIDANEDLPNIYLLIFDEYCGFNQIKKYYHYDNKVLQDFLKENRFTISYNGHNESIMTSTITTNIVNLDYVVTNYTSEAEKEVLRHNGKLFQLLESKGYEIRRLTNTGFYGEDYEFEGMESNDAVLTVSGESIYDLIWDKTAAYPFVDYSFKQNFPQIDFLSDASNIPTESTLTLMHVILPHTPFYFDENGNNNSIIDWDNWVDDKYYLGQYKYVTKLMIEVLDTLVKNDPNSLIIVMSDHGARASSDPNLFMEKFDLNDMNNFFNAFYYCGEDLEQYVDRSAVNTLRLLLNHVVNTQYEELEVPIDEYKYK